MQIKKLKYGGYEITQTINDKPYTFSVINCAIDPNVQYNFRVVSKCKAGYMVVTEMKATINRVITSWERNRVQTVEVQHTFADGSKAWIQVLVMKNNKFYRIDKTALESLSVGDIYHNFPAMQDLDHWLRIGATTYNCSAYGDIEALSEQPLHVVVV